MSGSGGGLNNYIWTCITVIGNLVSELRCLGVFSGALSMVVMCVAVVEMRRSEEILIA